MLSLPLVLHAASRTGSSDSIRIGMSAPLTGSGASYGSAMVKGVRAGIDRFNAAGGIEGRPVELDALDDAGDPERASSNTRSLIASGVLALTGYYGSKSVEASLPQVDAAGIPMIGAASSAESLRDPGHPTMFNVRAGAQEQIAAMVFHLDTVGVQRVAVVGGGDGLGLAGIEFIRSELARIGIRPVASAQLPSGNSIASMRDISRRICAQDAQAVILALDGPGALGLMRALAGQGCRPQFLVMSETGLELPSLASSPQELQGVLVSQVLPNPRDLSNPLVSEFRRDVAGVPDGAAAYAALEGYLYANVITKALRVCDRTLTRGCLTRVLASGAVSVNGLPLRLGASDRRGSRYVDMTILDERAGFRH